MKSLRRTALVWMTALLACVGLVACVITYELARREANGFLDGQLRQIALNAGDGLPDAADPSVKHDAEDDFVISIWNADGSPSRRAGNAIALPRQNRQGFATIFAADEDWRMYQASDGHRTVQVAQRMSVQLEMAENAAIQAAVPILVVIPLAWLVIGWSLGHLLGRVTKLARTVGERGVESREHIPVSGVPTEIRPLVSAMNALTDRLQQALEQQKRFIADAAHELRTPLAALHLQIDNLRARTGDGEAGLVDELGGGIHRASALVEQLLRLARSDESAPQPPAQMLDLTELVTQCVADFVQIAAARQIDLGMGATDASVLAGLPADLRVMVGNLIDNAIRYTQEGGIVDVSVRRADGPVVIEILDTGCGVAEADIPRLFDRFFRSAANGAEGSGLGLSIAASIARQHGLEIKIENRTGRQGLRVRVNRLPAGPSLIRS